MTTQSLEMHSGNTRYIQVTVKKSDGTAYDLTGKTINFAVRLTKEGATLFSKSSPSSGITIINAAGGIFKIQIDPADTTSLADDNYYHETKITSGSEVVTVLDGRLKIKKSLFTA